MNNWIQPLGRLREVFESVGCRRSSGRSDVLLFLAINGAGLGHLTRCLAIARRVRDRRPDMGIVFATTSIAVPLVYQAGFVCHHIPPFGLMRDGMTSSRWNEIFANSLMEVIRAHDPRTVVFDGTTPYHGLVRVIDRMKARSFVWVKRGLYKDAVDAERLHAASNLFDLTISPGEIADDTTEDAATRVRPVPPIVMLSPDELLPRESAKRSLGLNLECPAAYVQLGAGNINIVADQQRRIVDALHRSGVQVVLARSPIALGPHEDLGADRVIVDFPNSRYYRAFDLAVLAGGYNSVYEAVALGLPAIFVPNTETGADDQLRRCMAAKSMGRYEVVEPFDPASFTSAVEVLLRAPEHGRRQVTRLLDGAEQAAELILGIQKVD